MSSVNFYVMSKDKIAAKWENEELTVLDDKLLPLFLKRIHNVDLWLETRAIDSHRANSRLLKKALRLKEKDDISTVLNVNAATITDTYWIKPIDSNLKYADVKFSDDYFSELALRGTYDSFNKVSHLSNSRTPELTNIGSFEKCWKLINGKWSMLKNATSAEAFSELFICRLGKALGMNMAEYSLGDDCVITEDFTNSAELNFEPAYSFMGDNEDYEDVVHKLNMLCPQSVPDYIKMIFMDTICANPDRHTNNFGLLRDPDTGDLIGLAPCFDHNMALISRGVPKLPTDNDILICLFNELTDKYYEFKQYIPDLNSNVISEIVDSIPIEVPKDKIIEIVMARYNLVHK